jgi:hypothetical protein
MEYTQEKKEWNIDTYHLDESPQNYAEWKKSILKDYILNDSIYIIFLK